MDLNFRSVANQSELTGNPFISGDEVVSFLYQGESGLIERVDLLSKEFDQFEIKGPIICRWTQRIREKEDNGAEAKKQALQSSEELFLSLYETDENFEALEHERDAKADEELAQAKKLLKFFLSLYLERKRILRSIGNSVVLHVKSKKTYTVPSVEITDEMLVQLQGQLDNLVLI